MGRGACHTSDLIKPNEITYNLDEVIFIKPHSRLQDIPWSMLSICGHEQKQMLKSDIHLYSDHTLQ